MSLKLEDKKAIVADLSEIVRNSVSAIAADYTGLSVQELTQLRSTARNSGVYIQVVRNTLARLALSNTSFECMKEALVGPLILAFSKTEPGAAARLLRDFIKEHKKLEVRVISLGGNLIEAKNLDFVASLPTYNEAISQLMGTLKAPIQKFVGTLAAPHTKLVRTLLAIREQKEAA